MLLSLWSAYFEQSVTTPIIRRIKGGYSPRIKIGDNDFQRQSSRDEIFSKLKKQNQEIDDSIILLLCC